MSHVIVKKEDDTATAADVATGVVVTFVAGLIYFLKFLGFSAAFFVDCRVFFQ